MNDKPDEDIIIIRSRLSGEVKRDGITVNVHIYRGEDDTDWILEVVDSGNNSHLWDETFLTDHLAMQAFEDVVRKEGMKAFNPNQKRRLH